MDETFVHLAILELLEPSLIIRASYTAVHGGSMVLPPGGERREAYKAGAVVGRRDAAPPDRDSKRFP